MRQREGRRCACVAAEERQVDGPGNGIHLVVQGQVAVWRDGVRANRSIRGAVSFPNAVEDAIGVVISQPGGIWRAIAVLVGLGEGRRLRALREIERRDGAGVGGDKEVGGDACSTSCKHGKQR